MPKESVGAFLPMNSKPRFPSYVVGGCGQLAEFDDIGNRKKTVTNGRQALYASNPLNQVTSREIPDVVDVFGVTYPEDTEVTVNGLTTQRVDGYFYRDLEFPNATADRYETVAIESGALSITGHAFLPKDPESFTYDADGNLTQDGRFTYAWDAENRLVKVETRTDLSSTVPRRKVEFMYDYRGRRIQKRVSGWTGSSWSHSAERRFIWVDWMLVAETDENRNIVRSYLWGLDLAEQTAPQQATPHRNFLGSKAGGVGGLVAMSKHGPTIYTYPVSSDANGNVVAVGTDTIFEYDAFGNTVRATGPLVNDMPFRFSTKFHDVESGLYYYGYRYYSPGMGRWLNRDPIGEKGD
jgi:RHS repeat-associated protein